jgi:hypothetical protein
MTAHRHGVRELAGVLGAGAQRRVLGSNSPGCTSRYEAVGSRVVALLLSREGNRRGRRHRQRGRHRGRHAARLTLVEVSSTATLGLVGAMAIAMAMLAMLKLLSALAVTGRCVLAAHPACRRGARRWGGRRLGPAGAIIDRCPRVAWGATDALLVVLAGGLVNFEDDLTRGRRSAARSGRRAARRWWRAPCRPARTTRRPRSSCPRRSVAAAVTCDLAAAARGHGRDPKP